MSELEQLSDAEMVKGFRRWLSSTKETEIERRWMLRACTLAEKQLASAASETRTKTAGAQADAHNRKGGDIEDLSRVLTEDYSLWHGEDEHDHLGNIAGFVGRFEAEIERLKTSAPLSAIGRVMQEDASQLADMAGNARRYRAWRDGDVLVRRSPESGWEARHRDTPHWDVGSWHWSQSLDEVIDKAMKDGGPL